MRHNMLPWRGKGDDAWLVSMVVTFDAMMHQVAGGVKVAGAADIINFNGSTTVNKGGAAVAEDRHCRYNVEMIKTTEDAWLPPIMEAVEETSMEDITGNEVPHWERGAPCVIYGLKPPVFKRPFARLMVQSDGTIDVEELRWELDEAHNSWSQDYRRYCAWQWKTRSDLDLIYDDYKSGATGAADISGSSLDALDDLGMAGMTNNEYEEDRWQEDVCLK